MIEHRLYSIEKYTHNSREEKLLLCTPKDATIYALQGWTVFDFTESLDMEPELLCEHSQIKLFET